MLRVEGELARMWWFLPGFLVESGNSGYLQRHSDGQITIGKGLGIIGTVHKPEVHEISTSYRHWEEGSTIRRGPRHRFRGDPRHGSRGGPSVCLAAMARPVPFDLVCLQADGRWQDPFVLIFILRLSRMSCRGFCVVGGRAKSGFKLF